MCPACGKCSLFFSHPLIVILFFEFRVPRDYLASERVKGPLLDAIDEGPY